MFFRVKAKVRWFSMSNVVLWSITYEVDGKFYTTRPDYDHSWLCDISMDDLVLIEGEEQ
jgi:hypothetical protein